MASSWFELLLGLLHSHLDLLLFLLVALFFLILLYSQLNNNTSVRPTNWPVAGMFPSLLANLSNFHDWHTRVLRECGCTFLFRGPWLLGMDILLTSDPANVNHAFTASFANYPKGDDFADTFDVLGDGIFTSDGGPWRAQRRALHAQLSDPRFRSFAAERRRDKLDRGLVPLLSRLAEREAEVDLQDVLLRLSLDATCVLLFGVDPGCLSADLPAVPFAAAMDDVMEALFFRHALPPPCWRLMRRLGIWKEKKLREARRVIDAFVAQNVAKSTTTAAEEEGRSSLLTSYINNIVDVSDTIADHPDYKHVRDTAVNLMFAGRDTTATALSWFFWLLSENPRAEAKVLEELDSVDGTEAELAGLVYLHAALCESLRLYPPVHFEHKAAAGADVLPTGEAAPPGRKILFSAYAMGRMEGVWGEDCREFRPERWISERGRRRHEPAYKFLAFNCGPRVCLGKDIAFAQMKAVAAAVLCNFRVEGVEGQVVEPKLSVMLHMKNGWKVRIKKRKKEKKSDQNY